MEEVRGGDPLLIGMLQVAFENGLGVLMLVVGGAALLAGLCLMLVSGDEGRVGRVGNGLLFLGAGISMYPTFNVVVYIITDGSLLDLPSWLLVAPAIAGPLIGGFMAWLNFRAAKRMAAIKS